MPIDLKRITKGRQSLPPRPLIYSFDGVGKTQWAAGAPDPFFIDANKGSFKFEVKRVVPSSWDETKEVLDAIEKKQIECQTVVLDSITDLESMSHEKLFPGSTIDKHDGGYGRGENVALAEWRVLLAQLERIWMMGKAIVLVAHSTVKKFDDPSGPGYERFEVACRPKLAGFLRQWSDYVLFAREDVSIQATDKSAQRKVGVTTGARWMYTRRTPAYDAKARGTLMFPERLPLSWHAFAEAIEKDFNRQVEMGAEIDAMLVEIGDAALSGKVKDWLRSNPGEIVDTRNRVAAILEEKRNKEQKDG